jgi:hypothetical protein
MTTLTKAERQYIERISIDMGFYKNYKSFIGNVKKIYIKQGAPQAREYIKDHADTLLEIATDELLSDLFTNL